MFRLHTSKGELDNYVVLSVDMVGISFFPKNHHKMVFWFVWFLKATLVFKSSF